MMAPIPTSDTTRDMRPVPGNEGISIGANQDTSCFTIMDDGSSYADGHADGQKAVRIHICDWPELAKAVAKLMEDRAEDAANYHENCDNR